jgi:hypothetical protein
VTIADKTIRSIAEDPSPRTLAAQIDITLDEHIKAGSGLQFRDF